MKITVLGSGTSVGVPTIGCHCDVCTSTDPRDNRLRPSILVTHEGRNILIDYRWAAFDPESRQRSARELVVLQPDILLCFLARSEVLPSDAP